MIDFKTWRQLNESLGFNLGVSSPAKIGGVMGAFQYLDEKKKQMDADIEVDAEDMDVDGEDTKEDSDKSCDKMMMSKKKSKKKMKNEACACDDKKGMMKGGLKGLMGGKDMGGMDMGADLGDPAMGGEVGMDADMGDEDMGDMGDEELGDDEMVSDDDMGDEDIEDAEEEAGEDLDGDNEMGEPEDHIAKIKAKKAPMPLGFMKKKMKKENAENFLSDLQNAYMSPKNQTDTEEEFWSSIKGYDYDPNKKFNDGFTEIKEDMLLPAQPVVEQPSAAPQPGEVGFAPQQRLDTNYQLPPLEEGKKPRKTWF